MDDRGEKLVRIPIGLPPEQYEWLREAAFRRRTTMAGIVREALADHRALSDPQLPLPMRAGPEQGQHA